MSLSAPISTAESKPEVTSNAAWLGCDRNSRKVLGLDLDAD
jgi:hypothetical protein